jgi:calmodulin
MIDEVDADKDNAIDFSEFVTMMSKKIHDIETQQNTIEAFEVFVKDKQSGLIRVSELKNIMLTLGDRIREEEVDELLTVAH